MTLWQDIIRFNDHYFPDWRKDELIYLSNAMAGEVGEVCNDTKHLIGGGTHRVVPTMEKTLEELSDLHDIEWVIVGGESGPDFRPMDPNWARGIRAQCAAAGVPFFYKQSSGSRSEMEPFLDDVEWRQMP